MSESSSNAQTVGVRELSHHTSHILKRVKAGETLTITERGEAVATVAPLRRGDRTKPAVGYAASGDPTWASRVDEELKGFGE